MTGMPGTITMLVGYGILGMHLLLVWMLVVFFLFPESWKKFKQNTVPYALVTGAVIGWIGIFMSLYYSNIVGLPVCALCWWQRIALYPIAILFTIAAWKKDRRVFMYVLPLAAIGVVGALYHEWLQIGGHSLIPCSANPEESPCSKVYIKEFGYITFPVIALTVFVYYTLLSYFAKESDE